jgi:uncharacterized membrane protein
MNINKELSWFGKIDAHHRQFIALIAAALFFWLIKGRFSTAIEIVFCWLAYALALLFFAWGMILTSHPARVKKIARLQDSNRTFLFLFVVAAASVSVMVVIYLLKYNHNVSGTKTIAHVLLAIISVIISWCLVHTIFTLRYAHLYYRGVRKNNTSEIIVTGLEFPEEKEPDYLDFVYFSFVIGMTFQVSDVQITARNIRRLVWLHGMISFFFNTAILALGINIISSML